MEDSGGVQYGIVALSHLRWNFVWQRPQQFLSRFAQSHPILFIEEPEFSLEENEAPRILLEQATDRITVGKVLLPKNSPREGLENTLARLGKEMVETVNVDGAFDQPLLWFYNPMDSAWALDALNHRGVVYDCMDELSQFKFAPANLIKNEEKLIANADVVFTGGYELWLRKSKQHKNVHFFGCGVEYGHFAKAQNAETEIPSDVEHIAHPIIGWFGVVDERVDYDLIAQAASLRPNWNFVLVGPVVKVDPASLPKAANIHWLGQKDYSVLPNYCKAYDVCMMCFAINEATEYINPTKALEYLATGKPVISTPVKDVVRQYEGLVDIAADAKQFVELAEAALQSPDGEKTARGIAKARECSWESTVATMQELIEEAVARRESGVELQPV
jgi:glycosyltransferase involved in cell wall biosynthesis